MDENTAIFNMVETLAAATGETTTAIAKLKEIQRTTGISNRQSKKLLKESETNLEVADNFAALCQKNPGIVYMQKVGNFYMSNIFQVLEYAKKTINEEELVPNTTLDNDWIVRFLDVAGQTSNEEKQKILADVLIGKIKKPNAISYRTLRILKDLTIEEIKLFYKSLSVAFYAEKEYAFIPRNHNQLAGISISEIMILNECELIDSSSSKCLNIQNKINLFSCDKSHLLILDPKQKTDINCNYFTESALELIPFMTLKTFNSELIIASANNIERKNLDVSLYKINYIDNNQVIYNTTNLI